MSASSQICPWRISSWDHTSLSEPAALEGYSSATISAMRRSRKLTSERGWSNLQRYACIVARASHLRLFEEAGPDAEHSAPMSCI
ncbi:MAG: hypothetical protein OXB95_12360 [Rhodobacteraceae bacterium]|nr:hypothetical protein [Paracoccaceae bacterium]